MNSVLILAQRLFGRRFKIVPGLYGPRVALTGEWHPSIAGWMKRAGVLELECNYTHGCQLQSLAFIGDLDFLRAIRIVNQKARDFSPLSSLHALQAVDFSHISGTKDLPFQSWKKLEWFRSEWVKGMEQVFDVESLTHLAIDRLPDGIRSSQFSRLTRLVELSLSNGKLEEVSSLKSLVRLRKLQLVNMRTLLSLEGIEGLTALRCLRLDGSKSIRTIAAVADLMNLELLWFVDCGRIATLEPIRPLTKLKSVLFGGNTLIEDGDLDVLLSLPNLCSWGFASAKHYTLNMEHPQLRERQKTPACRTFRAETMWQDSIPSLAVGE